MAGGDRFLFLFSFLPFFFPLPFFSPFVLLRFFYLSLSLYICISRWYIPTVYAHTICLSRENIYRSHGARQLIYESETLRSIPVYVHLRLIKSPTNLGFPPGSFGASIFRFASSAGKQRIHPPCPTSSTVN